MLQAQIAAQIPKCVSLIPLTQALGLIEMTMCAKCGKEIPEGQEVKKGFFTKKSYHKDCT